MASWIYMNLIMPVVIRVVGGDIEAYRYLAKSTARFPRKRELAREWEAAGFVGVACHSRMMGSIAIHIGEAPEKEN